MCVPEAPTILHHQSTHCCVTALLCCCNRHEALEERSIEVPQGAEVECLLDVMKVCWRRIVA